MLVRLGLVATILILAPFMAQATLAQPPEFWEHFELAFPQLQFERPIALKPDPSGSNWLFVVEQAGKIRTFIASDDTQISFVVLDLTERVIGYDVDIEAGLLGLALHPAFGSNGYIYVYYLTDITGSPTARISRFTTAGAPAVAHPGSEIVLIELERQDLKHNGGDLHFSEEGYLYASFGDGVCCADPLGNGQDLTNLFSTIIRIDVDNPQGDLAYGIPPDNPFVGNPNGWREEIWAYGLRNPWRFSIHPETGEIWVGDVGELAFEEINRVVAGGNYGWSVMEGPDCFEWPPGSGQGTNCDQSGLIPPAWYYDRDVGISVTGGYVYRGTRQPQKRNRYIFADWGVGKFFIATLDEDADEVLGVEILVDVPGLHISAFGEDADGELYFFNYFAGVIYRFVQGETSTPPEPEPPAEARLLLNGANPFHSSTGLSIELQRAGTVRLDVFDSLGRRVSTLIGGEDLPEGRTDVTFSGEGLAAGVYFIRLSLDDVRVPSLKLTLLH